MAARKRGNWKRKAMPYVVAGAVAVGSYAGLKAVRHGTVPRPYFEDVAGMVGGAYLGHRLVKRKGTGRKIAIGAGAGIGGGLPLVGIAGGIAANPKARKKIAEWGKKGWQKAKENYPKWKQRGKERFERWQQTRQKKP